jgi:uncharacterized Tic20 family protein
MQMSVIEVPPGEERMLRITAAAAYLSYFVLPWVGPLLIFLLSGRRSGFARFHSTQAFNIQMTYAAVQVIGVFGLIIFSWTESVVSYAFLVLLLASGMAAIALAILGAIQSMNGRMVRYPSWMAIRLIH